MGEGPEGQNRTGGTPVQAHLLICSTMCCVHTARGSVEGQGCSRECQRRGGHEGKCQQFHVYSKHVTCLLWTCAVIVLSLSTQSPTTVATLSVNTTLSEVCQMLLNLSIPYVLICGKWLLTNCLPPFPVETPHSSPHSTPCSRGYMGT